MAQESKYHAICLAKLYKANKREIEDEEKDNFDRLSDGIALVELMGYIEETKMAANDTTPFFKLADLVKLYKDHLRELGVDVSGRIHSTDLKNRLLANIPGLQAYNQGKDVFLSFRYGVGQALQDTYMDN